MCAEDDQPAVEQERRNCVDPDRVRLLGRAADLVLEGVAGEVTSTGTVAANGGLALGLTWRARGPFHAGPVEMAGDINGTVVARGADAGVATPVNAAVLEVARRIEAGELEPGFGNLALLRG